ncbi:hypothetical protein GOP47_0011741 [Adiantum capillus-veneris]|uniref:Uncharacterized protein n=1 Tax=Adiantum capillus-veneris TaxID=13818 RepID=A0A9D4UUQ5_ADICA|nr:hypothetical protein GOP47_0011741 [Adiantum capillus-veneris]
MTQKGNLFKGQQKKSVPVNRHGKQVPIRKGKVFKKPSKKTEEMEINKEVQKFIDSANETKAAAIASKEGARLSLIKAPVDAATTSKKSKSLPKAKK